MLSFVHILSFLRWQESIPVFASAGTGMKMDPRVREDDGGAQMDPRVREDDGGAQMDPRMREDDG
jgi:hypothetical protein